MTTLTRILVATDMSARSDRAVRRAVQIARDHGADLTVMTVLDDAMPEDLTQVLHEKARAELTRFVGSLCNGMEVTIRAEVGDPTRRLIEAAEDTDLLVMGGHRPRPFLDLLRETTMQRVVRRVSVPVLLVVDQTDHPYATVLGACDFSPAATAAIRLANRLAPAARITPLHALHVPYAGMLASGPAGQDIEVAFLKEASVLADGWKATADLPPEVGDLRIETGAPYGLLRRAVEAGGVDLIAVGAHGRVGAPPSILGSLATDLMRDPPCDVLVARP